MCHKPFDKPLLILEKLWPRLKGNPLGLSLHPSEILFLQTLLAVQERSRNIENEMKTGRLNNPFQFAVNYLREIKKSRRTRMRKGRTGGKEGGKI